MPGEPPLTDAAWRRTFRRRLRNWYDRAARDLPWRRTNNAYHIWVSEIMLQQTQVATVIPYFERFLKAFPSVAQLANADEQTVLRYWEGLGYYRRARQPFLFSILRNWRVTGGDRRSWNQKNDPPSSS